MQKESLVFLVDMLNLALGKGEETDYFWQNVLIVQCKQYFQISKAMKYHEHSDENIINQERVNLNAFFFAVIHHLGIKINPTEKEQKQGFNRQTKTG